MKKIEELIKETIDQRKNGMSEKEIIKFVHIMLGKKLVYDNSYSDNFEKVVRNENDRVVEMEEETQMSRLRKEKLLTDDTKIEKDEQICKGLAEISVAILSKAGIHAKVIGVEKKGDIDGEIREDGSIVNVTEVYSASFEENLALKIGENEKNNSAKAKHYYALIQAENGEKLVQDFLMEKALARIKCGEALNGEKIPGICYSGEYRERTDKALDVDGRFSERLLKNFEMYKNENVLEQVGIKEKMDFIFEKINQINEKCGFEETNDLVVMYTKLLLTSEEQKNFGTELKKANLVRENEKNCDVVSIYGIEGRNYLVKGDNKIGHFNAGEISFEDIQELLYCGFSPRKEIDGKNLNAMMGIRKEKEISEPSYDER